jgi:hypothetical protein
MKNGGCKVKRKGKEEQWFFGYGFGFDLIWKV